jgi:hypothetical protein
MKEFLLELADLMEKHKTTIAFGVDDITEYSESAYIDLAQHNVDLVRDFANKLEE